MGWDMDIVQLNIFWATFPLFVNCLFIGIHERGAIEKSSFMASISENTESNGNLWQIPSLLF